MNSKKIILLLILGSVVVSLSIGIPLMLLNLSSVDDDGGKDGDTIPPNKVTGLTVTTNPNGNRLDLLWDPTLGDTAGYRIYRRSSVQPDFFLLASTTCSIGCSGMASMKLSPISTRCVICAISGRMASNPSEQPGNSGHSTTRFLVNPQRTNRRRPASFSA